MMRTLDDKVALARQCLAFCERLARAASQHDASHELAPTYAIVPVKALALAKRRLAPVLPDAARRRLVLAMLEDVLAAIAGVREIERVVVVTPDADAWRASRGPGRRRSCRSPAPGELNAAVESGIAFALSRGAAGRWSCRPTCPWRRRRSWRA